MQYYPVRAMWNSLLAGIIMLGMAYGRIQEKQSDKLRSLVQPAA